METAGRDRRGSARRAWFNAGGNGEMEMVAEREGFEPSIRF